MHQEIQKTKMSTNLRKGFFSYARARRRHSISSHQILYHIMHREGYAKAAADSEIQWIKSHIPTTNSQALKIGARSSAKQHISLLKNLKVALPSPQRFFLHLDIARLFLYILTCVLPIFLLSMMIPCQ